MALRDLIAPREGPTSVVLCFTGSTNTNGGGFSSIRSRASSRGGAVAGGAAAFELSNISGPGLMIYERIDCMPMRKREARSKPWARCSRRCERREYAGSQSPAASPRAFDLPADDPVAAHA